jgi:hypothetical protein
VRRVGGAHGPEPPPGKVGGVLLGSRVGGAHGPELPPGGARGVRARLGGRNGSSFLEPLVHLLPQLVHEGGIGSVHLHEFQQILRGEVQGLKDAVPRRQGDLLIRVAERRTGDGRRHRRTPPGRWSRPSPGPQLPTEQARVGRTVRMAAASIKERGIRTGDLASREKGTEPLPPGERPGRHPPRRPADSGGGFRPVTAALLLPGKVTGPGGGCQGGASPRHRSPLRSRRLARFPGPPLSLRVVSGPCAAPRPERRC